MLDPITYKVRHNTFGGIIYASDFETNYPSLDSPNGSRIARQICLDNKFDMECKQNEEFRDSVPQESSKKAS